MPPSFFNIILLVVLKIVAVFLAQKDVVPIAPTISTTPYHTLHHETVITILLILQSYH